MLESIVSAAAWCSKNEQGYSLKFFFMSISLPKTTPHPQSPAKELLQSKFMLLKPIFILYKTIKK